MLNIDTTKIKVFWDHLKALHDHFIHSAIEIFKQEGEVEPQLFILEIVQIRTNCS